jgi:hypothetical protein
VRGLGQDRFTDPGRATAAVVPERRAAEPTYSVSADGQRFVVVVPAGDEPTAPQLDVVVNWEAALREAGPGN